MAKRSNLPFHVSNALISESAESLALPTFVADLTELSSPWLDAEIRCLARLQTLAPAFRLVLITDQDIFGDARHFGWPIEHVAPRFSDAHPDTPDAYEDYIRARISIIGRHYANAIFVRPSRAADIADVIAKRLKFLEVPKAVRRLTTVPDATSARDWADVERLLSGGQEACLETRDGSVWLTPRGTAQDSILVTGRRSSVAGSPVVGAAGEAFCVDARFDVQARVTFESDVYVRLAQCFGTRLSVVAPWRSEALEARYALRFVDLGLQPDHDSWSVCEPYRELYEMQAGSPRFSWREARTYAAVRRVARAFSREVAR